MLRERDGREKKTGKRLIVSISCLLLLSGIIMLLTHRIENGAGKKEAVADLGDILNEKEDSSRFRSAGGFDNPIDDLYLPIIFGDNGKDKREVLKSYEEAWREEFEGYLEDYGTRCKYAGDREMAEEYLAAVQMAVDAQKELMEYMGAEEERLVWYSAQIYRCAFMKDIRGDFAYEETGKAVMNVSLREIQNVPGLDYEVCGEFTNEIDRQYVASMHDGCEVEIRSRQASFDTDWCNQLGQLTMEFYEGLDEEGKQLADSWQMSRENWKGASDARFWWTPEDLNFEEEDALFWGNGTGYALMEKDGWINRLYYLQLQDMMGKTI